MRKKIAEAINQVGVATELGLSESIKQSVDGWVNMLDLHHAMLINLVFVIVGAVLMFLNSSTLVFTGGLISAFLGGVGLLTNLGVLE